MEEFFTRQTANEGVKVPLTLPDGTATKHWLLVRGVDSDEFRKAEARGKQKVLELFSLEDTDARESQINEAEIECIASLIAGWSFDQELSKTNVIKFLTEAPQIREKVNALAARRSAYFTKKSTSLPPGSGRKSSSKRRPRAQK